MNSNIASRAAVAVFATVTSLASFSGQANAAGDPSCKIGFVWREARPSDLVCVTPESRARVAEENRTRAARAVTRERGQPYRALTCLPGFVWREAFEGDTVCVTPTIRTRVALENRAAPNRLAMAASTSTSAAAARALNPQPLPPRAPTPFSQSPAVSQLSVGASAGVLAFGSNRALNPQPLPPKVPATLGVTR